MSKDREGCTFDKEWDLTTAVGYQTMGSNDIFQQEIKRMQFVF